ncbi:cyclase family protein [Marinihelvus fidelis]|uniref:cyclase family protein n=1 Tax=Marinihelvus fidelis TaxID=2613842 RepID=UPI001CD7DBB0|nr:cyclase family protein [Marinihelvus fidelis]
MYRKSLARWLAGTLLFNCAAVSAQTIDFSAGHWVDLTHAYSEDTLYWPTADGFHKDTVYEGETPGGWYYTAYNIETAEHGGTHLDAPIHFYKGRETADQVPLESLTGLALVVDVSAQAAADADYLLTVGDLQAWEQAHGSIEPGAIVLVRTGWAERWPDAKTYLGTDQKGADAVPLLHFPGIGAEAAQWLAEREVAAVGIDTASVDRGQSTDFMAHRVLYEANIPGFENVADLSALPPRGAWLAALPMKIAGGSGAPLRIAAFVPGSAAGNWQPPAEVPAGLPPAFTYADTIPGIRVDLRYLGEDNFVGQRIDGYEADRLVMTRATATALAHVQAELAPMGLGLLVYDAYRPQPAVDHFVRWAEDVDDTRMKAEYYPDVQKGQLFAEGYIAAKSGHSRGSTVDLTLVDLASGEPLDMGTAWDFFGAESWVAWDGASAQQRSNRMLLRSVMLGQGFTPYEKEWWHFRFADEPFPETYFEAPIR